MREFVGWRVTETRSTLVSAEPGVIGPDSPRDRVLALEHDVRWDVEGAVLTRDKSGEMERVMLP